MSKPVLEVKNLTKRFKKFTAVDGISFAVKEGEIVGLLGPNGAGKTTTIQMLLGLMTPTQGEIQYFGKSLVTQREAILKRINHTSGYSRLPWRLSVWENLDVYGHLYEVTNHHQKIRDLARAFEITDLLPRRVLDLSAGQTTRVLLVKAFLNDPEVLLLDEPTASLDPDIADKIRDYIIAERKKRRLSIFMTSHNMQEVEELCDRVIFLNHGKILVEDTPEGLARRNKESEVQLMVKDGLKRLVQMATQQQWKYTEKNRFITLTIPEEEIASFLNTISRQNIKYADIQIVRPSLEDFFLSVSKHK